MQQDFWHKRLGIPGLKTVKSQLKQQIKEGHCNGITKMKNNNNENKQLIWFLKIIGFY